MAPHPSFYITNDEPLVARRRSNLYDPGYVGINRADLDVVVTLPINRRWALYADWNEAGGVHYRTASVNEVDDLNLRTVLGAHRVFYSPAKTPKCDEYLRTIGNRGYGIERPSDFLHGFWRRKDGGAEFLDSVL